MKVPTNDTDPILLMIDLSANLMCVKSFGPGLLTTKPNSFAVSILIISKSAPVSGKHS